MAKIWNKFANTTAAQKNNDNNRELSLYKTNMNELEGGTWR